MCFDEFGKPRRAEWDRDLLVWDVKSCGVIFANVVGLGVRDFAPHLHAVSKEEGRGSYTTGLTRSAVVSFNISA